MLLYLIQYSTVTICPELLENIQSVNAGTEPPLDQVHVIVVQVLDQYFSTVHST